ncbi:MAG: hypothetical protein JWO30_2045 [Fibrobacteres bacterium]|nr:hypothetical protein [Fibrobacterota bacterium]
MGQIFPPSANTLFRAAVVLTPLALLGAAYLAYLWTWSDFVTGANRIPAQPVPFSHKHHVSGLGIDCRYCHAAVEKSAFADLPSTHTCMTCHSQIWNQAAILEPVRESFRADKPIPWVRVNDLPGYVYFNHAIHVNKGVGCAVCHGPVDRMPMTWKSRSLYMKWCLDCHRDPAPFLRPREEVFNMEWKPGADGLAQGRELMQRYHIHAERMTDCTLCHR